MPGCVGGARDAAVGAAFSYHHVAKIKRVIHLLPRFVQGDAFGSSCFVVTGSVKLQLRRSPMIDYRDSGESRANSGGFLPDDLLGSYEGQLRQALLPAKRGCPDCAF